MSQTTPGAPPSAADGEPIMDAEGHFHATDAPIDLTGYRWEDWVTLAVFWALAFVVFYQFFTRYVLSSSAAWTEEIARYLLIVVTFVGASMAVRRNTHIHVEFLYRWLPHRAGRALATFVDLVRIGFFAYATWLTVTLVPRMHNLRMTVVDFPMSYVYAIVAVAFALMTFRAVQVAIRHWRRGWSTLERPGDDDPEAQGIAPAPRSDASQILGSR
ncbi:MAG TPA: TRAP transporter small permease [Burkholderiaceae bacterium]|jgi:TRAP-type transport system small permease protein|nr:TRAP transporter small permease [Burkholderiaceae bacterium]